MKLSALLQGLAATETDLEIGGLCLDSRSVQAGDAFIAVHGALQHGLVYAKQAVAKGAMAVVYDPNGADHADAMLPGVQAIAVENLNDKLGEIGARFYGQASKSLNVIGITGTNGKTTCSQLLAQALPDCGVIGTLGWGRPPNLQTTVNTTPDALAVQQMLSSLLAQNCKAVAMEVSSHGLEQGRVNAVDFKAALFTNLSRDHLDYHGTMDAYLQAKLALFKNQALEFAVLNLDDASIQSVLQTLSPSVRRWGFSLQGRQVPDTECLHAYDVQHRANGIDFKVSWSGQTLPANTPVIGAFNLQNVMAVLCALLALGWPLEQAVAKLADLHAVTGRMEIFGGRGKPAVIVDYAHTPDALEKVLLAAKGKGRLWTVFGCGGDRDKGKRPQMGRIAETYADQVVITDDNPRSEVSAAIIEDILAGCLRKDVRVINDRQTAINTAIQLAGPDDCVVIAGKGHENYQEINGIKMPFSDQTVVQQALATWGVKP